jgi:hypothetical protein
MTLFSGRAISGRFDQMHMSHRGDFDDGTTTTLRWDAPPGGWSARAGRRKMEDRYTKKSLAFEIAGDQKYFGTEDNFHVGPYGVAE